MAEKSTKRVAFEKKVFDLMDKFDKSGYNSARYKDYFNSLSNKEFDEFVNKLLLPQYNLHVELSMYSKDSKNKPPTFEEIEKIGKSVGIDLMEYIYMPFANPSNPDEPVVSVTKVLILVLLVRRMQQMLSKKNSLAGDTSNFNPLTNLVNADSKAASLSDTQTNALLTTNQTETVAELLTMRADDEVAEERMLNEIANNGKCYLHQDLLKASNKQTLKFTHTYLMAAGLITDILKNNSKVKAGESFEENSNWQQDLEDFKNRTLQYKDVDDYESQKEFIESLGYDSDLLLGSQEDYQQMKDVEERDLNTYNAIIFAKSFSDNNYEKICHKIFKFKPQTILTTNIKPKEYNKEDIDKEVANPTEPETWELFELVQKLDYPKLIALDLKSEDMILDTDAYKNHEQIITKKILKHVLNNERCAIIVPDFFLREKSSDEFGLPSPLVTLKEESDILIVYEDKEGEENNG